MPNQRTKCQLIHNFRIASIFANFANSLNWVRRETQSLVNEGSSLACEYILNSDIESWIKNQV